MRKKSLKEVAEVVDCEGIGYAITSYMGSEEIEDPVLADKWAEAEAILEEIERILAPYSENADDEEE